MPNLTLITKINEIAKRHDAQDKGFLIMLILPLCDLVYPVPFK
jgi:hypothetical protein